MAWKIDVPDFNGKLAQWLQKHLRHALGTNAIAKSMKKTAVQHIDKKHPNHTHWKSSDVATSGRNGITISTPGASRAYQDLDIKPKKGSWLTLAISKKSQGKRAKDFKGLFRLGKSHILATRSKGGKLYALFVLAKHVHQKKDGTLLPSDDSFFLNAADEWFKAFTDQSYR